jgi:signal recognition particle subunit SRP54
MIQSMTGAEKSNPKLIDKSRATRIAKGCGRQAKDIEGLVDRFMQMRQMMGSLGKQGGLLSGLGGGGGGMGGGLGGMMGGMPSGAGFDPSMMMGGGGRSATKKRQDPKARKNKRKQAQKSRKKKRKK